MTNIKLIASKITKINAEKNPEFTGKLEIKTNIRIISIDKVKESKDALKVSYLFEIDYTELGKISIEGNLFISTDPKTTKQILKIKENKKMESQEYIAITNLINQKASIKALELEEEIGLPIHMRLPVLTIKNN
jgi:hypothetical protein